MAKIVLVFILFEIYHQNTIEHHLYETVLARIDIVHARPILLFALLLVFNQSCPELKSRLAYQL